MLSVCSLVGTCGSKVHSKGLDVKKSITFPLACSCSSDHRKNSVVRISFVMLAVRDENLDMNLTGQ